jgi:hypothetical protein
MYKFYMDSPKKYLFEFPDSFEAIYRCRDTKRKKAEDSDEDLSFNAKLTQSLTRTHSSYTPKNSSHSSTYSRPYNYKPREGAQGSGRTGGTRENVPKCFFCPGEHKPWDCPHSIPERIKIASTKSKCLNCFRRDCKGTQHCTEPSKCRTCPAIPKHSSWICQAARDRYLATLEAEKGPQPQPRAKAEFTRRPAPQGSYSATDAATIAASIAELQDSQNSILAALTHKEDPKNEPSENSTPAPTSSRD